MKTIRSLFAVLALVCGAAQAQLVDNSVPGSFAVDTPNPQGNASGSWQYAVDVQVVVADLPGDVNTQAAISVNGNAVTSACSGRGCQPATRANNPTSVTMTAPDGSQPVTFTPTVHTQPFGIHAQWTTWAPSASVPVGTYTLHIEGTGMCQHRPLCGGPDMPVYVSASTTFDVLPTVSWATDTVDASLQAIGVAPDATVVTVPANDTSGPQQVCDLYDQPIQAALQALYDWAVPGQFQVDSVTSTASNPAGQWVCTYHVTYEDLVNAPGAPVTLDSPDGWVTVKGV